MNLNLFSSRGAKSGGVEAAARFRARRRGSSVLIILVFLTCMAVILAANSTALSLLKQELKRIDRQQQQKYGQGARH